MITTTNPRTGISFETEINETSAQETDSIATMASLACGGLDRLGREGRAQLLEGIAQSLESRRDELVQTADQESGLGTARLDGELTRAIFQFSMFAGALREGSYLEAIIDHAGDAPTGPPVPDVRRMLVPIGPVVVFGASNFPFAFSVAGGDTASALAAGCPTILKAHDSHPLTSLRSFEAIASAMQTHGAPRGSVNIVFGQEAARQLVSDPLIKAVSFTGSLTTGQMLLGLVNDREEPIPFYGELSSINPLIVTAEAARMRSSEIAQGLFSSLTGSGGQLCTKPGIVFVPSGTGGDSVVNALGELTSASHGQLLLNKRIAEAFTTIADRLIANGARLGNRGESDPAEDGFFVAPTLLTTTADELSHELAEECFGPLLVVARYESLSQVGEAFNRIPSSLTATIHAEDSEGDDIVDLTNMLAKGVGRIIYNGYPTGVRVCWAQNHGGPWPSTNSLHTSVGVTAIRRFLRPFAWQDPPVSVLPAELRDGPIQIPRRVDGALVLPTDQNSR